MTVSNKYYPKVEFMFYEINSGKPMLYVKSPKSLAG